MKQEWDESNFIEDKLTPISEAEGAYALREAWLKLFGEDPDVKTWAIIWAHTALETGRYGNGVGGEMHCYNFGNTKSRPNDGFHWTMYRCSEILNGKEVWFDPPHDQTKFKAFQTMEEGAAAHIKFLTKDRYVKALAALKRGNVTDYVLELKAAGYFTAGLNRYLRDVRLLTAEFLMRQQEFAAFIPNQPSLFKEEEKEEPEPVEAKPPITLAPVIVETPVPEPEVKKPTKISVGKTAGATGIVAIVAAIIAWLVQFFDKF